MRYVGNFKGLTKLEKHITTGKKESRHETFSALYNVIFPKVFI